jgi:hypothetical protein
MIGCTYQDREVLGAKWLTTYQSVSAVALSQGFNVNTSQVSTSFPNFALVVSNLWSEYRCTKLNIKILWTFNTAASGLYIPAIYLAQYRGDTPPAQTLAGLQAVPWVKTVAPPGKTTISWSASADDPEAWIFRQTTGALPVTGGVVGYVGAAAPTSTVAYMVLQVSAKLEVRGRKV